MIELTPEELEWMQGSMGQSLDPNQIAQTGVSVDPDLEMSMPDGSPDDGGPYLQPSANPSVSTSGPAVPAADAGGGGGGGWQDVAMGALGGAGSVGGGGGAGASSGKQGMYETGGAVAGAIAGSALGGPAGAQIGGMVGKQAGSMIGAAQEDGDEQTGLQDAQEEHIKERTKHLEMRRKAVNPGGISEEAYTLGHMGPLTRIPGVANFLIEKAGGKKLSKQDAVLNLIRPPIPAYQVGTAQKLQSATQKNALAQARLSNLTMGMTGLEALSSIG